MPLAIVKKPISNNTHKKKHDVAHVSYNNFHVFNPNPQNTIKQRKPICPCDGGCPRCAGIIQPKLRIGQPNDIYEQEADRVAEEVMRMPDLAIHRKPTRPFAKGSSCGEEEVIQPKPFSMNITPLVQRKEKEEEEKILRTKEVSGYAPEVSPGIESRINEMKGGGQPLPEPTRTFFESRFGFDFGQVRIHTDTRDAKSSEVLHALAYTVGPHIAFRAGCYNPYTIEGKRLIAHELAHVRQQDNERIGIVIQRYPEYFGDTVLLEVLSVCPPQVRVIDYYPDEDIACELYGDSGHPLEWSPEYENIVLIDFNDLLPQWMPYFYPWEVTTVCPPSVTPPGEAPAAPPVFEPVREALRQRALAQPWPVHQVVYDRWRAEGRQLGIEGLAPTWDKFLEQMREMDFMGHRVVGHEVFLTRLHQAQAYLRSSHPDIPESELVPRVGTPESRSQWRAGERGSSYHVFGMAIDIDGGRNPWIADPEEEARNCCYIWTIWRSAWLIGGPAQAVWPRRLHEWGSRFTTEQLWEQIHLASEAVRRYFELRDNEEQLGERVNNLGAEPEKPPDKYPYVPPNYPIEALSGTDRLVAWQQVIAADQDAWPGDPTQGFMNLRLELVHAMRDIAHLAWGATELGTSQSGDFMHFDLRTPQFEQMRSEIRRGGHRGQVSTFERDKKIEKEGQRQDNTVRYKYC